MGTEGIRDRYINPYTDFGFKKLFGTDMNKELLISFLNALLEGKEEIEEITYLNVEQMGDRELDRRAVFDVYCRNSQGERFLVEMQKGEQEFFKDRGLYYTTFPIREQAKRGSWDYELKGVYTIAILNFVFDNNDPACYRHDVKLVDLGSGKVFYDKLTGQELSTNDFAKQFLNDARYYGPTYTYTNSEDVEQISEFLTRFDKFIKDKCAGIVGLADKSFINAADLVAICQNDNKSDLDELRTRIKQAAESKSK